MEAVTNFIEHLIVSLGGFGVFLASVLEEIIIPIPSVLVQSGAGLFLLGGQSVSVASISQLVFLVAIPSALGVTIGSLLVYGLVFFGETYAIEKYGKYFFIKKEKIEEIRSSIIKRPSILVTITVLRFVPLFPNVLITAACGLLKIPIKQYLVTTFIGIFVRALYLGAIGWFAGSTSKEVVGKDTFFGKIGILLLLLAVVSIITSILISSFYNKKNKV